MKKWEWLVRWEGVFGACVRVVVAVVVVVVV